MISCLKSSCDLTTLHSETFWTGTRLGHSLLVRSLILLFGSSFWPQRSPTVAYSLVALRVAVLLKWMKWMNTELFRNWPKRHSREAQQLGMNGLLIDVTRSVATEDVRYKYSLRQSIYVNCSWIPNKFINIVIFNLFTALTSWKCGFIIIGTWINCKYSTFKNTSGPIKIGESPFTP